MCSLPFPRAPESQLTAEQSSTGRHWNSPKKIPHIQKQEKSQINNLTLHLKELEKEEQTKPKVSTRKEIIKIRADINEIETKKAIAKINKTKS